MERPWKNRLIVSYFLSYLAVVLLLFFFFYFYSGALVRNFYISSLSKQMQEEARVVSRSVPFRLEGDPLDKICRDLAKDLGVRLTVVALDGKVLGDSDERSLRMENHGTRPEVIEALSRGKGQSIRYSNTVKYQMLYQAILERNRDAGRIVRISVPLRAIDEAVGSMRRTLFLGLLSVSGFGLVLALFFSRQFGKRIRRMAVFSNSVARGLFPEKPLSPRGQDELSELENNLNEMNRSIQEKIKGIVAEKEKAESILRCMSEGVLVMDTSGRVILLNENVQRMFELPSPVGVQGASLMEVSRHPEMKRLMEEVLACGSSTECFSKELPLDSGKWFQVNSVSLRDGEEKTLGFLLVFHDVTELKRLETVRADFVANVSHELRTPLTAIQGYTETLLYSPPAEPKDREHFLSIIHRHSQRLGRLIDDLLALSDLESGRIRLETDNLDAGTLIGRVLEIFQEQAKKRGVVLSHDVEPQLPPILGDADRLQQLLINLIDNAIKYTPSGGRVNITAGMGHVSANAEPMVEIAVADTGCGVAEKDLPRLTERFYRVDKARSRELGGTGLGLAIVKHIVQAHGGVLRIESQVQRGTTVRVLLPLANSAKDPKEIPSMKAS